MGKNRFYDKIKEYFRKRNLEAEKKAKADELFKKQALDGYDKGMIQAMNMRAR